MIVKNGFLLIELMIGFSILCFLFFIIAHYIIEIKNIQQEALTRIEMLSIARSAAELMIAHQYTKKSIEEKDHHYTLTVRERPISIDNNGAIDNNQLCIKNITCEKQYRNRSCSLCLPVYVPATPVNGICNET